MNAFLARAGRGIRLLLILIGYSQVEKIKTTFVGSIL